MRTLILHIGVPKTGTTSIQRFLIDNRPHLREQNIFLSTSLAGGNPGNNRNLSFCFVRASAALNLADAQAGGSAEIWQQRLHCLQRFAAELNAHTQPQQTWILSSEYLWAELTHEQEIRALRLELSRHFSCIKVVVYLRHWLAHEISRLSQHQKAGRNVCTINTDANPLLDYAAGIQRWQRAFQPDALIVRRFQQHTHGEGDVIDDFCRICGIQERNLTRPARQNVALSLTAMRHLWHLNRVLAPELRSGVIAALMARCNDGSRVRATAAQWRRLKAIYAASDAWLSTHCFPDDPLVWHPVDHDFSATPIDLSDPALIDPQLLSTIRAQFSSSAAPPAA